MKIGSLQYDAVFRAAQRLTDRPVKIGSCCGRMVHKVAVNDYYGAPLEAVMAFSRARSPRATAIDRDVHCRRRRPWLAVFATVNM